MKLLKINSLVVVIFSKTVLITVEILSQNPNQSNLINVIDLLREV